MEDSVKMLCAEKHKSIDATLERHEGLINDQGEQLNSIKLASAKTETIVQDLCEQIKELVTAMKEQQSRLTGILLGIAGVTILTLIGFFIWYIESLPR
jgi:hypothetical protein